MKSTSQDRIEFIPLCSFGRLDNIFYQGAIGLTSPDLSPSSLAEVLRDGTRKVVAGHFLDISHWEEYLQVIKSHLGTSILLSYGYEFKEHQNKIDGMSVFLIIDRPIEAYRLGELLPLEQNYQWVIVGNKLYTPSEILESLRCAGVMDEKISYSFIEPRLPKSSLLSIEEIALWQNWFQSQAKTIRQIVFCKSGDLDSGDLYAFRKNSQAFENELKKVKEKNQMIVYLAYIWTFFSIPSSKKTLEGLFLNEVIHPLSHYFRWRILEKMLHIGRVTSIHIGRINLNFFWQRFRWEVIERPIHIGRVLLSEVRYRILPIVLWPVFKVFWFLEYQWKTRILKQNRESKR